MGIAIKKVAIIRAHTLRAHGLIRALKMSCYQRGLLSSSLPSTGQTVLWLVLTHMIYETNPQHLFYNFYRLKIFVYFLNLSFQSMFETTLRHSIISSKNTFFWFKIRVLGNIFSQWGRKMCEKVNFKEKKRFIKILLNYSKNSKTTDVWD